MFPQNGRPDKSLLILKKVPRKPHPLGHEYKTSIDSETAIIMRLVFCGDPLLRAPAPREKRTVVVRVKQLKKPLFCSGRTIVADSWFGSPKRQES